MLHKNLPYTENHVIHSLVYTDAAARTGATGLVAADVGRVAQQLDTGGYWVLHSHSPVVWAALDTAAGQDTTAIHVNASGEINGIALKASPATTDIVVIEDSDAAWTKKKATITSLPVTDTAALHKTTSGEIAALTAKAAPVAADLLVIEDSAAANAKKKITVGSIPIAFNEVDGSTTVTTTSTTDVLMTGQTVTPVAGDYLVWFSGEVFGSVNGGLISASIYFGGVQEAASARTVHGNQNENRVIACMGKATLNGSQAIEVRWKTSAGTASCTRRQLYLIRIK